MNPESWHHRQSSATQSSRPEREKLKILLVDDDIRLSDSLGSLLRVIDYDVVNVYNGSDALSATRITLFDAAIVDIHLPDIEGTDLIPALRGLIPEIGILILSGEASLDNAVESVNRGADAFILKPTEPNMLISKLKKVLRVRRLEKDLKASEERYRQLFENICDGAFQTDLDGRITDINAAGVEILGFRNPSELIDSCIWNIYSTPEDLVDIKSAVLGLGEIIQRLTRFRKRNNSMGWLETTLRCRYSGEKLVGFEGIFRDVTDRIRYQEMLEALYSLWSDLTEVESFEKISELTLEFINAMLMIDTGSFKIVEGTDLRCIGDGIGIAEPQTLSLMGSSLSARAVRTCSVQLISDADEEMDHVPITPWGEEIISILAVPIKIEDTPIAVIEIGSVNPAQFADEDQKLVEVITEHVASAMNRIIRQKLSKRSDLKLDDFR